MIATKVRGSMKAGVNDVGLGRKHIMSSCLESLRRLQTDHIDLYQVRIHIFIHNHIHNIEFLYTCVYIIHVTYISLNFYPERLR